MSGRRDAASRDMNNSDLARAERGHRTTPGGEKQRRAEGRSYKNDDYVSRRCDSLTNTGFNFWRLVATLKQQKGEYSYDSFTGYRSLSYHQTRFTRLINAFRQFCLDYVEFMRLHG